MDLGIKAILLALGLTSLAGLATGIGSAVAFFAKRTNTRFLALSLGFSAGMMIYISLVEILQQTNQHLVLYYGGRKGTLVTLLSFFSGMGLIALIDRLVPSLNNPHEYHALKEIPSKDKKLMRVGFLTTLALSIHNFPEGLANFTAVLNDPLLGIPITIAIAIHNIPEGMAISIPIYYATGSRKKAFVYSLLSGLGEPLGAILGFTILLPFYTPIISEIVLAATAGIMVFISLDELLPTAEEYGQHHQAIYGVCLGMLVTSLTLFFLQ